MSENILQEDCDLIQKVSQGDERAFRALFDRYRNKIYSLGIYLTRSEIMAEELVQDVFLKVWKCRTELASVVYFNAWLRTIAKNTCSNYLRSLAIEKMAMMNIADNSPKDTESFENELIVREFEQIIQHAITQLPPQQQKVYLLSKQCFKKQDEIAKEMDISIYTVKEYMKLAQRSIRRHLETKAELASMVAITIFLH